MFLAYTTGTVLRNNLIWRAYIIWRTCENTISFVRGIWFVTLPHSGCPASFTVAVVIVVFSSCFARDSQVDAVDWLLLNCTYTRVLSDANLCMYSFVGTCPSSAVPRKIHIYLYLANCPRTHLEYVWQTKSVCFKFIQWSFSDVF